MAAHISHYSPLTSRSISTPLQNSRRCRLFGKSQTQIFYKTDETPRNMIINCHHLHVNTSVYSSKPGSAIILERKQHKKKASKAILNSESVLIPDTEENKENLEYYNPKKGDLVVGVVVSCNENKLKINIGSESLASMHLSEFLPINKSETAQITCELPADIDTEKRPESLSSYSSAVNNYCDRFANGRMGILMNRIAATKSVIEEGTVIYAEVLGRAFNGEALLSSRLYAIRIAWRRLRQIKHINKPIEVTITEWNISGLVSRIEGLRGFLPRPEMINTPLDNFSVLKEYVGTRMEVVIIDVNEEIGHLVVSERTAWEMKNLYEGALLQGTIKELYADRARVMVDGTGLSGFLHISEMSCKHISSVTDLFSVGERVKVMLHRFKSPNKLFLSTAKLESENGLILSNKERVFEEAEEVAAAYRSKFSYVRKVEASIDDLDICDISDKRFANWDWFTN